MSYSISIDKEAYQDIVEAVDWYNEQQEGLGDTFIDAFELTMSILVETPFVFRIRFRNTRKAPLSKFPYFISYLINEQEKSIQILTVLYGGRDLKVERKRIMSQ